MAALGLGAGAIASWVDAQAQASSLLRSAEQGTAMPGAERSVFAAEDRTTALLVTSLVVGGFAVGAAIFTRWVPTRRPAQARVLPVWRGLRVDF